MTLFAAKASMAGLATPQAIEPSSGMFDIAKLTHGFVLLVINGVMAWDEPPDKLSIVSANFVLTEEVTPLVSIDHQLSFRYCS